MTREMSLETIRKWGQLFPSAQQRFFVENYSEKLLVVHQRYFFHWNGPNHGCVMGPTLQAW